MYCLRILFHFVIHDVSSEHGMFYQGQTSMRPDEGVEGAEAGHMAMHGWQSHGASESASGLPAGQLPEADMAQPQACTCAHTRVTAKEAHSLRRQTS